MGDIRWSFFNFINAPNQTGPLGYGPSSPDPITGELINGTSNAYGAAIDYYAQYLLDIINIVNGYRSATDVGYGRNVQSYFDDLRAQYSAGATSMSVDAAAQGLMTSENLSPEAARVVANLERMERNADVAQRKLQNPRMQAILKEGPQALLLRNDFQRNPLNMFKGTPIEQKVIFPELIEAAQMGKLGMIGDQDQDEATFTTTEVNTMDKNVLDVISPLRGLSVRSLNKMAEARDLKNLKNRIHMAEDFFDAKFIGWARQAQIIHDDLKSRGVSDEQIQDTLWFWVRGKSYLVCRSRSRSQLGSATQLRGLRCSELLPTILGAAAAKLLA